MAGYITIISIIIPIFLALVFIFAFIVVINIVIVVRRRVAATPAKHPRKLHNALRARRLARAAAQQLARGQRHVVLVAFRISRVAALRTGRDTSSSSAANGSDSRTLKRG
jgi:hypothetical protein